MRRKFGHITPRYVWNRLGVWFYQRNHQQHPWLTATAIRFLEDVLKPSDRGIEWGSGRSTRWFASQVGHLTSVESNRTWFDRVTKQLAENELANVDYNLVETTEFAEEDAESRQAYAQVARKLEDHSLDFALIDGLARGQCMLEALPKLKAGGILILDNANWYLPGKTHAPRSLKLGQEITDPHFKRFAEITADWRCWRTSNGVWDTWFWLVPAEWGSSEGA